MTCVSGSKGMTDRACPAHMVGVKMLTLTVGKVRGGSSNDKSAGWPTGTESSGFVAGSRTMAVGTLRIGIGPCALAVAGKTSGGRPLVRRAWIGETMRCTCRYVNYAIDMFAWITEAVAGCVHMWMTASAHRA